MLKVLINPFLGYPGYHGYFTLQYTYIVYIQMPDNQSMYEIFNAENRSSRFASRGLQDCFFPQNPGLQLLVVAFSTRRTIYINSKVQNTTKREKTFHHVIGFVRLPAHSLSLSLILHLQLICSIFMFVLSCLSSETVLKQSFEFLWYQLISSSILNSVIINIIITVCLSLILHLQPICLILIFVLSCLSSKMF